MKLLGNAEHHLNTHKTFWGVRVYTTQAFLAILGGVA